MPTPHPAGCGPAGGSEAPLPGLWARLVPSGQPASQIRPRPLQPAPRGARLGDHQPRLFCSPGPGPPRTLIVSSWGGRAEGAPGPCIIRGLNGPAARAGRRGAGGGAADPARVWPRREGALLSSSRDSSPPPLGPGPRGAGSGRVVGLARGRGLPRCIPATFALGGGWEACSESEPPRDLAPEGAGGVGMQVSSEHSAALFSEPLPPAPGGPLSAPARQQPCELALGPGPAPFPGSGRRWMEAETQGQGRGARRPGAPLCARARPSSTLLPLPDPQARALTSDLPGRGELRFRTPENSRQWPQPQNQRARGGAPLWGGVPARAFVLGPGGAPGSLLRPPPAL